MTVGLGLFPLHAHSRVSPRPSVFEELQKVGYCGTELGWSAPIFSLGDFIKRGPNCGLKTRKQRCKDDIRDLLERYGIDVKVIRGRARLPVIPNKPKGSQGRGGVLPILVDESENTVRFAFAQLFAAEIEMPNVNCGSLSPEAAERRTPFVTQWRLAEQRVARILKEHGLIPISLSARPSKEQRKRRREERIKNLKRERLVKEERKRHHEEQKGRRNERIKELEGEYDITIFVIPEKQGPTQGTSNSIPHRNRHFPLNPRRVSPPAPALRATTVALRE